MVGRDDLRASVDHQRRNMSDNDVCRSVVMHNAVRTGRWAVDDRRMLDKVFVLRMVNPSQRDRVLDPDLRNGLSVPRIQIQ